MNQFTDMVRTAMGQARRYGRLGYVASVYEHMADHYRLNNTMHAFKRHLVAAERRGELILSCGTLVASMDTQLFDASEIQEPERTYHFICLP